MWRKNLETQRSKITGCFCPDLFQHPFCIDKKAIKPSRYAIYDWRNRNRFSPLRIFNPALYQQATLTAGLWIASTVKKQQETTDASDQETTNDLHGCVYFQVKSRSAYGNSYESDTDVYA
jgi:hypothetical protein